MMIRSRPDLRARFRGVTEAEYAALYTAAAERRQLTPTERMDFGIPQEAEDSLVGAVLWSSFVLMQDRPIFLGFGMVGGLIALGYRFMDLIK